MHGLGRTGHEQAEVVGLQAKTSLVNQLYRVLFWDEAHHKIDARPQNGVRDD